jgi:hypothetical protein
VDASSLKLLPVQTTDLLDIELVTVRLGKEKATNSSWQPVDLEPKVEAEPVLWDPKNSASEGHDACWDRVDCPTTAGLTGWTTSAHFFVRAVDG